MANYIDPLANSELLRALAFARARETYPGLEGALLLEICEAAWERAAGDPSDGLALVRFEKALDLIARQYRIGGGRLTVAEVADQVIPASALSRYVRSGERARARAADPVPIAPTHAFGSRLPRLAPAPLGAALAGAVFGVAAAAQAGVLPPTPITPGPDSAGDSKGPTPGASHRSSASGVAPVAESQHQPGFLASASAARTGMDSPHWIQRKAGPSGPAPAANGSAGASPVGAARSAGGPMPASAPAPSGGGGTSSAPALVPATSAPAPAPSSSAPSASAPVAQVPDVNVGPVQVDLPNDTSSRPPSESPPTPGRKPDTGERPTPDVPAPQQGSTGTTLTRPDGQAPPAGVYVDVNGDGKPEIRLPNGQVIPVPAPTPPPTASPPAAPAPSAPAPPAPAPAAPAPSTPAPASPAPAPSATPTSAQELLKKQADQQAATQTQQQPAAPSQPTTPQPPPQPAPAAPQQPATPPPAS